MSYNFKYNWNAISYNISLGVEFPDAEPFIEFFFDDFFIRGDGKTILEAEENVKIKYDKIKNCQKHTFKRTSDFGNGVCIHCDKKISNLKTLTKCVVCGNIAYFFLGYKNVCSIHFCKKVGEDKKDDSFINRVELNRYNNIKYIKSKNKYITELDLYNITKDYLNNYLILMDLIEEVFKDVKLQELYNIADRIRTDYNKNKVLLEFIETKNKEYIFKIIKKEIK